MRFRSDRKHDKALTQRDGQDEELASQDARRVREDRARSHPVRAGLQRLRRAIDERETRAVLRDFSRGSIAGA